MYARITFLQTTVGNNWEYDQQNFYNAINFRVINCKSKLYVVDQKLSRYLLTNIMQKFCKEKYLKFKKLFGVRYDLN